MTEKNNILPPQLAEVILKVKRREELNQEEELIYLMYIEEVPEEEARKIINNRSYEGADDGNI